MKTISKYIKIIKLYSKNSIIQKNVLLLSMITMFSRCVVTILLYSYAYKVNNNNINNSTFIESAWSMFFYFSLMMFSLRKLFRIIETDILSGSIENQMIRPIDYIKHCILKKLGEHFVIFVFVLLVGSAVMYLLVGIPSTFNFLTIISIIVTLLLGIILSLLLYGIIGLLAFYIEKVSALFSVIDKFVMVLGGSYLPIALFPKFMKNIATFSPFGAVNFVTSTAYKSWESEYILKISMQLFWIFVLYFMLNSLYKKAKERLAINGG